MKTIYKIGRWLVQKIGVKTLSVLLLLCTALGSSAYGFSRMIRALNADFLIRTVILAALLAWILARSQLKVWISWIMMTVFGILVVVI
jgi:hypothetical protein